MVIFSPFLILILVILLVIGLMAVAIFNSLVVLRNRFTNAWAQADVHLHRRYDLIAALAAATSSQSPERREATERLLKAREMASTAAVFAAANPDHGAHIINLVKAESHLNQELRLLLDAISDSLKTNEKLSKMMIELLMIEESIDTALQAFNHSVMTYNTAREKFPNLLFTKVFQFLPAKRFDNKISSRFHFH